jgi:hypothetical protein
MTKQIPQHVTEHAEGLRLCRRQLRQFHEQSPDKLGLEHVRDYRLHLMSRGLKAASINPIVGALRLA